MRLRDFSLSALVFIATLAAQPGPPGGSIKGRVTNSLSGTPIRKASVSLTGANASLTADTGREGDFEFTGLPPGTYRLAATHSAFLERRPRRQIALGLDEHVKDAEIRLPPQGAIGGQVLDQDGDPVDRAQVWIFKQVYQEGRKQWDRLNVSAQTNETGEYRFRALKPGRYLVQAFNHRPDVNNRYGEKIEPKSIQVPTFHPNAHSQQTASPVDLGLGAELRGIDIRLARRAQPPRAQIRGRVTGLPPDSRVTIAVGLTPDDDTPFAGGSTVATPPDYSFELTVALGEYSAWANVSSGGPEAYYASSHLTVTGGVSNLLLTMSPAPRLTGRLSIAESGRQGKLQGVAVRLRSLLDYAYHTSEARSDVAGKFGFDQPIRPGRYAVDVRTDSLPEGCYVQKIKLGEQEASADDVEIKIATPIDIVLSSTAGKITGSVIDSDGRFVADASATLTSEDGTSRPRSARVGDGGAFEFGALRPGTYRLFAWERLDEVEWQDPDFLAKHRARSIEVKVGPSETRNAKLSVITMDDLK